MSTSHDPTRRRFLGTSAAAGAAVLLVRDEDSMDAGLWWSKTKPHPLAKVRCILQPGDLPVGTQVVLTLTVEGPGLDEAMTLAKHQHIIDGGPQAWPLRLSYTHADLVPGCYRYRVTAVVGDTILTSAPLEYELRPFRFGV